MDGRIVPLALAGTLALACPAAAQLPPLPSPSLPQAPTSALPQPSVPQVVLPAPNVPLTGFTPALPGLSVFGAVLDPRNGPGPRILSLVAPSTAVVGAPATFSLAAAPVGRPVSGLSIDFGESGGRFGESACRRPAVARNATFSISHAFTTPGPHVVRFEVSSGTCSSRSRTTGGSVAVDVAPATRSVRQASPADAAVGSAGCSGADAQPTATNRTAARLATLCLLNAVRAAAGLPTLASDRPLRRIAGQHSRDMVLRRYFSHTAPPAVTLLDRLNTIHWAGDAGENLGYGTLSYSTPRSMMQAWMNSTDHRSNILDPSYRNVGIAISLGTPTEGRGTGATYTTDFGGP